MDVNLEEYILVKAEYISKCKEEKGVYYDLEIEEDSSFHIYLNNTEKLLLSHNCDGFHINGLLTNMFHKFWPELFQYNMINRFITPIVKVFIKDKILLFYHENEFMKWKKENSNINFKSKYYKGLGTSTAVEFKEYLKDMDKHLIPLTIDDEDDNDVIDLLFNEKRADNRKEWLNLT